MPVRRWLVALLAIRPGRPATAFIAGNQIRLVRTMLDARDMYMDLLRNCFTRYGKEGLRR